ncbi:MAG TPA: hypothetical protein VN802_01010 [Stellaceae bacterium]|nr:hypothetical protein [Stellaceae bacterium]
MSRLRFALLAASLALAGCGSHEVHYQNTNDPTSGQAQFDRDQYDCERQSERLPLTDAERAAASSMIIDQAKVDACMADLGWRRSEK